MDKIQQCTANPAHWYPIDFDRCPYCNENSSKDFEDIIIKLNENINELNEDILYRFLMRTAVATQTATSAREPGMRIIAFAFYTEDFDNYLREAIDLGSNKEKRLEKLNKFIKKHFESHNIWLSDEIPIGFNHFYVYTMY